MLRKIVSLTALASFLLTIITSFVLYIAPQGRIAYWSDWHLLGLTKTQWGNLHINLGTLFLIALCLHVFYNWKPITAYLSKARKVVVMTRECCLAGAITLLVGLGTFFELPPFSNFLAVSEHLKDVAARQYGEPPYGHAELSTLDTLATKAGLTPEQALAALQKAGFPADNATETLLELSRRHQVSPQRLYSIFVPDTPSTPESLPASPPSGTGNLPLADLCARYDLAIPVILRGLEAKGIKARSDMTLRQIGEANGKSPQDIYTLVREAAAAPRK